MAPGGTWPSPSAVKVGLIANMIQCTKLASRSTIDTAISAASTGTAVQLIAGATLASSHVYLAGIVAPFGQAVMSWNEGANVVVLGAVITEPCDPSPAGTVTGGVVVVGGGGRTGARMSRPSSLQAVRMTASAAEAIRPRRTTGRPCCISPGA